RLPRSDPAVRSPRARRLGLECLPMSTRVDAVRKCPAWLALVVAAWAGAVTLASAAPAGPAPATKGATPPAKAAAPQPPASPEPEPDPKVLERWTGDLDGMRERRAIRALVPYSKTFFFFDGAQPRGLTYEALKTFEDFVNEKFKTGLLRIQVV